MNSEKDRLDKFLGLARKGRHQESPGPVSESAPIGFATRVAARWAETPKGSVADAWERLAWWGGGLAAAACVFAITLHRPEPEPTGFDLLLREPAVEQPF